MHKIYVAPLSDPKNNIMDIIMFLSIDKALESYIDSYQTCPLLATHLTDKTITHPPVPCLVKGDVPPPSTEGTKKNTIQHNQNNHISKRKHTCIPHVFVLYLLHRALHKGRNLS